MPRIDLAEKKWGEKMPKKGAAWKKGVTGKESDYCKGVAEFIGVSTCNPEKLQAWREGVARVSAEDFAAAVRGKEHKWRRKYVEAMTGTG